MAPSEMNRRDFQKLAAAAMGGVIAGASAGCGDKPANKPVAEEKSKETEVALVTEKHICRGLNSCKGQGKDGKNACAGQGTCSTVKAHDCGGQNECKAKAPAEERQASMNAREREAAMCRSSVRACGNRLVRI